MNKSEELYKKRIKIQRIKSKLNSKILAYITSKEYIPQLEKTKQYIKEWASKTLKNAKLTLLHGIIDYTTFLQDFYCSNITLEYLLEEYIQENQKGETK